MQVESIGWEFDVLQANTFDDAYPRLEAVFVGVAPAIAYDAQNHPKFNRTIERHLRDLEKDLRQTHQTDLSTLGTDNLAQNLAIITRFVTDYQHRLAQDILIPNQLELESLTLGGEWLLLWNQAAPLVQQKDREREPMPFSEPATSPETPASQPTPPDHPDDGTTSNGYMPV